jgi:hypothetical protein
MVYAAQVAHWQSELGRFADADYESKFGLSRPSNPPDAKLRRVDSPFFIWPTRWVTFELC